MLENTAYLNTTAFADGVRINRSWSSTIPVTTRSITKIGPHCRSWTGECGQISLSSQLRMPTALTTIRTASFLLLTENKIFYLENFILLSENLEDKVGYFKWEHLDQMNAASSFAIGATAPTTTTKNATNYDCKSQNSSDSKVSKSYGIKWQRRFLVGDRIESIRLCWIRDLRRIFIGLRNMNSLEKRFISHGIRRIWIRRETMF